MADAGLVRTYYFDAAAAREQDREDREARKPSMVREDKKLDTKNIENLEDLREWVKSMGLDEEGYINDS